MVKRNTKKISLSDTRRFTVSLEAQDYDALLALAGRCRPRQTLQYMVEYAIQNLLRRVRKGQPLEFFFDESAEKDGADGQQ